MTKIVSLEPINTALPTTIARARRKKLPGAMRMFNSVVAAWERISGRPAFSLSVDKAIVTAIKRTGLADFGTHDIRAPLEVLCAATTQPPLMTPSGRASWRETIIRRLRTRLQIEAALKASPTIRDEPIVRPWFIVGLGRTGTTLIHRLLAQDPAHRAPLSWETLLPVPAPGATAVTDRRPAKAARLIWMLERVAPELKAIHEFGVDLPEECAEFLASSLRGGIWISRCEGLRRWLQAQDPNEAYEFHKLHLQILQHGYPRRRWVLKSPVHLGNLAGLLRTYPDAAIIQTHRDPAEVLPSLASLLATLQSLSYDEVDPVEVGRDLLEDSRHIAYTAMRERSAMSGGSISRNSSFVDVRYQDLVKDPLAVIARIYETFGVSLSDEAAGRMRMYLRGNGQHKLGRHRYSLEEFGLEKTAVRDAFREYVAQYLGESAGPAIPLQ